MRGSSVELELHVIVHPPIVIKRTPRTVIKLEGHVKISVLYHTGDLGGKICICRSNNLTDILAVGDHTVEADAIYREIFNGDINSPADSRTLYQNVGFSNTDDLQDALIVNRDDLGICRGILYEIINVDRFCYVKLINALSLGIAQGNAVIGDKAEVGIAARGGLRKTCCRVESEVDQLLKVVAHLTAAVKLLAGKSCKAFRTSRRINIVSYRAFYISNSGKAGIEILVCNTCKLAVKINIGVILVDLFHGNLCLYLPVLDTESVKLIYKHGSDATLEKSFRRNNDEAVFVFVIAVIACKVSAEAHTSLSRKNTDVTVYADLLGNFRIAAELEVFDKRDEVLAKIPLSLSVEVPIVVLGKGHTVYVSNVIDLVCHGGHRISYEGLECGGGAVICIPLGKTANKRHDRAIVARNLAKHSTRVRDQGFVELLVCGCHLSSEHLCLALHPPDTLDDGSISILYKELQALLHGVHKTIVHITDHRISFGVNVMLCDIGRGRPGSLFL